MQGHFPDVVPPRFGAPGCLLGGYSLDGLFEIWPMPGLFLVGFVKQREHNLCGIHGNLHKAWLVMEKIPQRMARPPFRVNVEPGT